MLNVKRPLLACSVMFLVLGNYFVLEWSDEDILRSYKNTKFGFEWKENINKSVTVSNIVNCISLKDVVSCSVTISVKNYCYKEKYMFGIEGNLLILLVVFSLV